MINIGHVPVRVSEEAEKKINAMYNDEEGGEELFLSAIEHYSDFKRTGERKYITEIAKAIGKYEITLSDFIKWVDFHTKGA